MRRRVFASTAMFAITAGTACTSLLGDFTSRGGGTPDGGGQDTGTPALGDSSSGESGGEDAGADTAPTGEGGTLQVVVPDAAVYVGQTAVLTASATPAGNLTFDWTVTSVPAGSVVTAASFTGTATATASFVPDVAGMYVLHVVSRSGSASGSHDVHVTAATAKIFYARYDLPATGTGDAGPVATETYVVSGADATGAHAVTCPTTPTSTDDPYRISTAFDSWEPPAGQPYRFAGFYPVVGDGGGSQVQLVVGTSDSTCASPPQTVGVFDQSRSGLQPRFSPDGSRIAFYNDSMTVVTIGADGTDEHVVVPSLGLATDAAPPSYDVGADSSSTPPRIQWTASGSLAWARSTSTGWQIVTAPDEDTATVTIYMNCLGATPHQIAMLSDGTVIAAYRPDGSSGAENIFRLKLDASKDCQVQHAYTSLGVNDAGDPGFATDFSLSPDEKLLAFDAVDKVAQSTDPWLGGDYPGGYLYVVPVDGSAPPSQVTADPSLNGPRFVAGGAALAYTRIDTNPYTTTERIGNLIRIISHPPTMSVRILGADGGASRIVDHGDGTSVSVVTAGNGGSCSLSRRTSPGAAGLALSIVGLARAARRRRRRKSATTSHR